MQSILETLKMILEFSVNFFGFSPLHFIPVFLITSLFNKILRVKKYEELHELLIGLNCTIAAMFVSYFIPFDTYKDMIYNGIILASICAMTYQIFKSLFQGIKKVIEKKWQEKTGTEIEI